MQQEKSHIQQVIDAVFDKIHSDGNSVRGQGEKKNLEDALAAEQTSDTAVSGDWLSNTLKRATELVSSATPPSITLLTALIKHLVNASEAAHNENFFDTTWYLLKYLKHQINDSDQDSGVVKEANDRRKELSTTLSKTYKTQASQAKEAHESLRQHKDETRRLAKFKERLNCQDRKEEKEEEKKVLSWGLGQKLHAQEGSTEQQVIIDSYCTLDTIHEAKERFYQAAELKESGIALQKKYLEQELGMNKHQDQFLEEKDTEKMEHRVDALAELTQDQNQLSSQNKPFTFYALIRDTRQKNPLISNPDERPQPAEEDKARAKAALENYLAIKALGRLQATHFQDTATLKSIALFLMQTTLLAQNTALPNPFKTFRKALKQQADNVLATAKTKTEAEAEAEAKQASPALTERQTALRLQLAQMAVAHYCGAEENQASTAFQIQSEKKEVYFTRKIEPAMNEVVNLDENDLSFWLAFFPNGNHPDPYSIEPPEKARNKNHLFYALAPKTITEEKARAREEKATEAANQTVETLQKELTQARAQLNQTQVELVAQKDLNGQLKLLQDTLRTQTQKLNQAQAEAKKAQDALQTQLTQAQADAEAARAEEKKAQADAEEARAEAARAKAARAEAARAEAARAEAKTAQAPSAKPHFAAQLVGAMGATIAYLVLSPEKGEMPPSLQLGIIAASFLAASSLAFTLINVFVYRCRANNHGSQVTPGQGGELT